MNIIANSLASGIQQYTNNEQLFIFPDPADDNLDISWPGENSKSKIQLTDLSGKIIYENETTENELLLNALDYPDGMYLLTVANEQLLLTRKIIISH
jgi:hypothetical protein